MNMQNRLPILHLTWRSILNRRLSFGLTVLSVALAAALLLGVERLRENAREGFSGTITGTDLVVGARSGPVQLLLYAVFHLGNATNQISWQSIEAIAAHPRVAWVVPIALGDSHRGHRVLGTQAHYFEHYRYADQRKLQFAAGKPFADTHETLFEAVIGAEVARTQGYELGEKIILSHGMGTTSFADHDDKPFTVVGILERSGTPNDRSVFVSLAAIEAIHLDWHSGAPIPGLSIAPEWVTRFDLQPKQVTAALVGLNSRVAVFQVQRFINTYPSEPLLAVLPGATLQELWEVVGVVEQALLAISALVVLVGLAGLTAVLVSSISERRRELAILRALGAGPWTVFRLLALEGLVLTLLGCSLGLILLTAFSHILAPIAHSHFGLILNTGLPSAQEWLLLSTIVVCGILASLVPGWRAYRYSLADGMSIRI